MINQFKTIFCSLFVIGMCACSPIQQKSKEVKSRFILSDLDLPSYEKDLDHKGFMLAIDDHFDESMTRGEVIYKNNCLSCHGTPVEPGTIPSARKFWVEPFKYGHDSYALYQTITKGFGSMPPQMHLTPIEKYDVIHYIQQNFIAKNPSVTLAKWDEKYLSSLPKGESKGPLPKAYKPWAEMDYGNFLINTYELVGLGAAPRQRSGGSVSPLPDENFGHANFAYKGIAIRLDPGKGGVAAGKAWMMFDHDVLRVAGAWTGEGFIDWEAILFNGKHNISPRTVGDLHFSNPVGPGWANPLTGSFEDFRFMARDKRRFGPLPKEWAHYKGIYQHGDQEVIKYTVGNSVVLEMFGMEMMQNNPVFTRTLNITKSSNPLKMRVAPKGTSVAIKGAVAILAEEDGFIVMKVSAQADVKVKLCMAKASVNGLVSWVQTSQDPISLENLTRGGKTRYPEKITTDIIAGTDEGAFQVDILNPPFNPIWRNQLRLSGIDFFQDKNKGVVCSSDGDIWKVEGFTTNTGKLVWQRIASGLFQPLGIKVIDEVIYVTCRDQLVRLNDFNGDGETDFYESFNNDHQVTDHFHEFAMGLQTDKDGNFYYAKSARHAREALVPQHGTLIKVSKDGLQTEIVATGFRAANGVCINPDGSFIVTDQEGHWNPMNRINWVNKGGFYGNMFSYHAHPDSSNASMEQPLVWVDRELDQSPSELLWVDSPSWGSLHGKLLNFSYGYGKVFVIPFEKVNGQLQGGIVELPMPRFSTGIMRGRFNSQDGQLYLCGLSAWGSTQSQLGGLYRIKPTNKPLNVPLEIHATNKGIQLVFANPLSSTSVSNLTNYQVKIWDLLRSRKYGSKHYNEKTIQVEKAALGPDMKSIFLTIPAIKPTWGMEIKYQLMGQNGKSIDGLVQNTIHQLANVK